ncbi:MAG: SURF1 family protein [Gemmatimonadales bacterium]|nr:SURF1 family protein [Gemmatimonadales bacterium]
MPPTARRVLMGLLLLAAAGFARLGFWQLGRLRERRAGNVVTAAARRAPPIALTPALGRTDTLAEYRVVARGRYDHAREIVVRGAVLQGVPGVRLVTPLLLSDGGPAVLVDRGFLPAPDAVTVDAKGATEPGEVEVSGIALPMPAGGGEPLEHGGRITWRRLDLTGLRARMPYEVLPIVVQQGPNSVAPSFPRRAAPPPISDGPHAAYAVQWFLFAGMAAAFAVLVVRGNRAGPRPPA